MTRDEAKAREVELQLRLAGDAWAERVQRITNALVAARQEGTREMRERAAMACEKRAAVLRHAQRADTAAQELDDSAAEIRELAAGAA